MVKEVNNMENYTIRKKNTEISSPWEDITFWWLFFHAFLYTFMWKQKSLKKSCLTVCDPMDRTVHGILQARILEFLSPGDLPNPGMEPHCGWILYQSSHQGSPRILAWVAYPFSSRSSQPKKGSNQGLLHCRWIPYQLNYQDTYVQFHISWVSSLMWKYGDFSFNNNLYLLPLLTYLVQWWWSFRTIQINVNNGLSICLELFSCFQHLIIFFLLSNLFYKNGIIFHTILHLFLASLS